MFKKIITILILLFILMIPIFSYAQGNDPGQTKFKQECKQTKGAMVLQVPIPGIPLLYNGSCGNYEFVGDGQGNLLVSYIKYFYKFFVGIAGIIAVFMIMFGGVQWLFSGGNPAKITSAKETIFGAVAGLFIALGSYVLLIQINPQLVKFNLTISPVDLAAACYNENGEALLIDQLPCGLVCTDVKTGNQIVGKCQFCDAEPINFYHQCGESKKGNEVPVADGNCMYRYCTDICIGFDCVSGPKPNEACLYASKANKDIPEDLWEGNNLIPFCADELSLTFDNISKKYDLSKKYSYYTPFVQYYHFNCGGIYIGHFFKRNLLYGSDYQYHSYPRKIGTECAEGKQCIIDLGQGIDWMGNNPNDVSSLIWVVNGFAEVGNFVGWECK